MNVIKLYGWGLIIRVLVLSAFAVCFGLVFLSEEWIFTQSVLLLLICLTTLEIIRYLNSTNNDINRFLDALQHQEFSTTFLTKRSIQKYSILHKKLEEIKSDYAQRANENESQIHHYQSILRILDQGILLMDENKNIVFHSERFNELLGLPKRASIDNIENTFPNFFTSILEASDQAKWMIRRSDFNHQIKKDLSCQVHKYKSGKNDQILVLLSNWDGDASGATFETWVNFSKVISHEILNGISPLIALTGTMKEQLAKIEGNEKVKTSMSKALNIIEDRTTSLQAYSERYRTLNKLPEPKKESLVWENVIQKIVNGHENKIADENIKVTIDGDALDEVFKADAWQMDQVFSNLLLNSINALKDANQSTKTIHVHVSDNQYNYLVTWKDNGVGVDKNNRANIFMPFFTTRNEGSGIGLSVIKQILWKHNADIFLSDNEPGATFIMRFPKI